MEQTAKLEKYLSEIEPPERGVQFVYLFGSMAAASENKDSDMDLAIRIDPVLYKRDPFEASVPAHMTAMKIGMRFGRRTDVLVLNSASIEMAYIAVTSGICVYERDIDERCEYEAVLRGMYFDFRPFLENLRKKSIERLRAET